MQVLCIQDTLLEQEMTYGEWVQYGQQQGWIGPLVCSTHDGIPMSVEEEQAWEDGEDPCQWIFRRYDNAEHQTSVEYNHAPSRWRQL